VSLLAVLVPLWLAAETQALPSFASVVETVRLDVSVTRDGRPVKSLRAESFRVEDEGVSQPVELLGQEETAVHAVLALDTSQSVEGARLLRLQEAAHAVVNALRPEDTLSILTFAECAELSLVGSRDRAAAHAAIDRATTRRTTGLYDATLAAFGLADPALGRPLVLLFSDGQDVGSFMSAERVRDRARDSDAVLHAILPPGSPPAAFLTAVAEETGGRVWTAPSDDRLDDVFLQALEEFRSRYRLRYELVGAEKPGWHRIRVRLVNGASGVVRARPGYRPRFPSPPGGTGIP
jgi:VWFA-related protein